MNIVMVGPFGLRPKGTMSARALPLARALAARGHRVCLVLPPWNFPEDSGKTQLDAGVQITNIKLPPRVPGLAHLLITWRLMRATMAEKPDVVHCFKPKAYAGLAAFVLWLGRLLHLTHVRLVVDSDDWEGRGGWNEIEPYSHLQRGFFAWQEQWGLTHADAITVASRTLQAMVWSLGFPPQRTFYIPNGSAGPNAPPTVWSATTPIVATGGTASTPTVAAPAPDAMPALWSATTPIVANEGTPTVLLYTRFFEFKLERAVAIVQGIVKAAPAAHVLVVGAGLHGEERAFLSHVDAAGLSAHVTYTGWLDPSELPAYFAAAQVAIYPFDDTLVNRTKCAVKLIDLLSAGVPVVADRVGQNAEYIEHGVSGILVEPGDTAEFVAWVVRLVNDATMRDSLGENARRRMSDRFRWDDLAGRLEDAYK